MPQTKLVFIKLLLELADDTRFTLGLNDSQKLDYLLMLLSAGVTHNEIPTNNGWFKARFCLQKSEQEIEQNLKQIRKIYKKFIVYRDRYKFKNFKELHNYIYKEKEDLTGILKEFYKNSENTPNIYYIISLLISYYINIKKYKEEDIDIKEKNRYGFRLKELLIKAKGNQKKVEDCIKWVSEQNYIDWTLETCIKKWPDFMASKEKPKQMPEYKAPKEKPFTNQAPKEFTDLVKNISNKKGV